MERRILHFRVISFAVAVARVRDPSLHGKPVLMASGTGPRSIVLALSEEARSDGVSRGLVLPEAMRRSPRALVLLPDPDLYARATGAILSVLERFSPVTEPGRGGRFYADLTGMHRLFGAAVDVAARIQREIRERLWLPANAGVAVNKLVSGVAARVLRPVGLCDVLPGQEASFLRPVAVGNLPAVNPEVEGRLLSDLNVTHVGQLAALPCALLAAAFGRAGPVLHRQAHGLDDAPVRPPSRVPVVEERIAALPEDTNDDAILLAALYRLVERGCRRLRQGNCFAGEAIVSVRYSDGATAARRVPLRPPLNRDMTLFAGLRSAFVEVVARRGRVRSMTLRLARLGSAPAQMPLFPGDDELIIPDAVAAGGTAPRLDANRERSLLAALDHLRAKHGECAVMVGRASTLSGGRSREAAAGRRGGRAPSCEIPPVRPGGGRASGCPRDPARRSWPGAARGRGRP